ncbi:hypothetical protein AOLI_G00046150 [Acnodon oligacanthus]
MLASYRSSSSLRAAVASRLAVQTSPQPSPLSSQTSAIFARSPSEIRILFAAAITQTHNRTYLLCPVCKKTQWSLPVHLRRSCMKNSPGVDIERTVDAAKREANDWLRRGRVWEYYLIRKILDNPDPVGRQVADCFTLLAFSLFNFTT